MSDNNRSDKRALARIFSTTSAVHDSTSGLFAHFGSRLVAWSRLNQGMRVLDVAAGTGASMVPVAERIGRTGSVVGVDISPGMVARLEQVIAANRLANAQALVADAEQLPFPDGSFDAVVCGFGLFFFPDPLRALKEFRRVMRSDGIVALSTFTREGSTSMDAIWRRIGEFTTVPLPADEGMRFHDAAQLRAVLSRAGYVDVETEELPFDVVLPDVDSWLDWLRSMEFVEYLERLSPASLEKLRTSARADLTDSTERSAIRFPMDALLTRARKPARRSTPGLG